MANNLIPYNYITAVAGGTSYALDYDTQGYILDATSGNITLTLPTILADGQMYIFTRVDTSANTVTIKSALLNTINKLSSITLTNTNTDATTITIISSSARFDWFYSDNSTIGPTGNIGPTGPPGPVNANSLALYYSSGGNIATQTNPVFLRDAGFTTTTGTSAKIITGTLTVTNVYVAVVVTNATGAISGNNVLVHVYNNGVPVYNTTLAITNNGTFTTSSLTPLTLTFASNNFLSVGANVFNRLPGITVEVYVTLLVQ